VGGAAARVREGVAEIEEEFYVRYFLALGGSEGVWGASI